MKALLKVLESLERKKAIGTLVLGRRGRSCELFLEEDRVYFAGKEYSGKVDIDGLQKAGLIGQRLSTGVLDTAISSSNLFQKPLPDTLLHQGLISQEEYAALMGGHLREEIFAHALRQGESFAFHEDQVPVNLLGGDPRKLHLPLGDVIEVLRSRLEAMAAIEALIPSRKEVFVVCEKGMAHRSSADADFADRRIFPLIDGFRDLNEIVRDVPFFEFTVLSRFASALQDGFLKKTVLPEVRDLNLVSLTPEEAEKQLPAFKAAVKHAVDEIGARERLALVFERLGQNDEAIIQYNFIGDSLYRMKKIPKALKAFQRALELKPDSPLVTEKVIKIHQQAADEALAAGNRAEAIRLLKTALEVHPEQKEIFDRLLALHLEKNETRALADLCDLAAGRSRSLRDIGPALEVLQTVLDRYPREKLFRKKLINLYIDFDKPSEAVGHLEELARAEMKEGQRERAQEIYEKILRIDPRRADIRRRLKKYERHQAARRIPLIRVSGLRILFLLVATVLAYQGWSWLALGGIREAGKAFAISSSGSEGIVRTDREKAIVELAARAEQFEDRFPLTIPAWEARRIARSLHDEADRLARARDQRKEELLAKAQAHQIEGHLGTARDVLEELLQLEPSDVWRVRAQEMLDKIESYDREASSLAASAEEARTAGDWPKAYGKLTRLLDEFPLSRQAITAQVPVEVVTVPAGASLRSGATALGRSPQRVWVRPSRPATVEVEADGYDALKEEVALEGGPRRVLMLDRRPLWRAALGSALKFEPVFAGGLVLVVRDDGDLVACSREDGSVRWTHPGRDVVAPIAPPVEVGGRLHLALNDGQLLRFSPSGEVEARAKVPGLPNTRLALLDDGVIAFGTANGLVTSWKLAEGRTVWSLALRNVGAFARSTSGRLLLSTDKGKLLALEPNANGPAWEAAIDGKVTLGPWEVGGVVLAQTQDKALVAVDGKTGAVLWRRTRMEPRTAAAIDGGRLLVLEEAGGTNAIVQIQPENGRELLRVALPLPPKALEAVAGGVVAYLKGGGFLYLDSKELKPLWGRRGVKAVEAASDGKLLVLATEGGELLGYSPAP